MTHAERSGSGGVSVARWLALIAWFSMWPAHLQAQTQTYPGDNVAYNAQDSETYSHAFIDASTLTGADICAQINAALLQLSNATKYPAYGEAGVIDARGINPSAQCSASPWAGITTPPSSTILLPAGTIVISQPWVLPPHTDLIGEGNNIGSGTTIQACVSSSRGCAFSSGSNIIQFGSSSLCTSTCLGISVENLILDGQGQTVNGIANPISQDLSYVDHVSLYQILGIGLSVTGNANNSGPYSNIIFDTGTAAGDPSTTCAQIKGVTNTRGLHGITCISRTMDAENAILLDASNNSLEDVRIIGFVNGIVVGSQATAKSNVLFNVYGDTLAVGGGPVINVIVVSGTTVTDLSIMGVANAGGTHTFTISDALTSTELTDPYVAMYVLGRQAGGATGYSRFTSSPNTATWLVGTGAPSGTCTSSAAGSLYSNTGSGTALYYCPLNGGTWHGITPQ
jgi:hypothetical protein